MKPFRLKIALNPILLREVRARWRRTPTFYLLFGYSVLLAGVLALSYANFSMTSGHRLEGVKAPSAVLGNQLFVTLAWLQTIGWMLLTPALAAPSIVSEREKGLLQSLQLSGLTPREIVHGKLYSLLWLIGLLLLVPLPVLSICFLLGGVSPQQFVLVLLLQAVTAVTGSAIGLNCSAWEPTTSRAMLRTALHGFCWLAATPCCCVGIFVNPIYGLSMATNPLAGDSWQGIGVCLAGIFGQAFLVRQLLRNAGRSLQRPPEEKPPANAWEPPDGYAYPPPAYAERTSVSVEWSGLTAAAGATGATKSESTMLRERNPAIREPEFWNIPIVHRIHTQNPVFEYEFHRRSRLRYGCVVTISPFIALAFFYAFMISLGAWLGEDHQVPAAMGSVIVTGWLIALILAGAVMGALSFSRDRECGMLASILVTPLRPIDLITGKLGPILFFCSLYSVVPLTLILTCLRSFNVIPVVPLSSMNVGYGITVVQLIAILAVLTATTLGITVLGMLISWFSRRTAYAVSWTIALVFALLVAAPALSSGVTPNFGGQRTTEFDLWSPFTVLGRIAGPPSYFDPLGSAYGYAMRVVVVSMIGLALLHAAIKSGSRERDRSRPADAAVHGSTGSPRTAG